MLTVVNQDRDSGTKVIKRHHQGRTFEYLIQTKFGDVVRRFPYKRMADAYLEEHKKNLLRFETEEVLFKNMRMARGQHGGFTTDPNEAIAWHDGRIHP